MFENGSLKDVSEADVFTYMARYQQLSRSQESRESIILITLCCLVIQWVFFLQAKRTKLGLTTNMAAVVLHCESLDALQPMIPNTRVPVHDMVLIKVKNMEQWEITAHNCWEWDIRSNKMNISTLQIAIGDPGWDSIQNQYKCSTLLHMKTNLGCPQELVLLHQTGKWSG